MRRAEELPNASPEEVGMSAARLQRIDAAVESLLAKDKLAGAVVAVARRGRIVHFEAYGYQDREARVPMRKDTIFRVYSMTKAITSVAALSLCETGQLELDAPVARYVPELGEMQVWREAGNVDPRRPMTVRDLLRHTAGLCYGIPGDPPTDRRYRTLDDVYRQADLLNPDQTLADMCHKLARLPLLDHPGQAWTYSIATDVLGHIIAKVTQTPLDVFLRQRVFAPLEMRDTGFSVPADAGRRLAAIYYADTGGLRRIKQHALNGAFLQQPQLCSGGGGLVSTAGDYLRFLAMITSGGRLHGRRVLTSESIALMTTNQLPERVDSIRMPDGKRDGLGFGLGFSVRVQPAEGDPASRCGEFGWGGAASTHYWVSPADELAVVTLEQVVPYSPATELALKGLVYDAILE